MSKLERLNKRFQDLVDSADRRIVSERLVRADALNADRHNYAWSSEAGSQQSVHHLRISQV